MSSGRSWSYQVVSAEELRRRALAAANARLERANQSAVELQVAVAAAEAIGGRLDVTVPDGQVARSDDPAAVTRQAVEVEAAVARFRVRVEAAVADARAREIDLVTADLLEGLRPVAPSPELTRRAPRPVAADAVGPPPAVQQLDEARRVVGRLPGDAGDDVMDRCRRLVVQVGAAATADRGAVLVAALRQEVQAAKERSDLVTRNRAEVERLYRQLDGLDAEVGVGGADPDGPGGHGGPGSPGGPGPGGPDGDAIRSLRGHLRGLALDAPLPADLVARVEQVRAAAQAAQDRRFALAVTREVFEEQGYTLGEDFVTVVATHGGATLPLAASRRHGVRVRETAGRIFFEVVRFDRMEEGLDDVAAATAFCHSVDAMVERAGRRGLGIADRVFVPPGEGRVERLDRESPFPARPAPPPAVPTHTYRLRPKQRERHGPR